MTKFLRLLGILSLGVLLTASAPSPPGETRFFHEPTVCGGRILFVHAGDPWTVPLRGGAGTPRLEKANRARSHKATSSRVP